MTETKHHHVKKYGSNYTRGQQKREVIRYFAGLLWTFVVIHESESEIKEGVVCKERIDKEVDANIEHTATKNGFYEYRNALAVVRKAFDTFFDRRHNREACNNCKEEKPNIRFKIGNRRFGAESVSVCTDKCFEKRSHLRHIRKVEYTESENYDDFVVYMHYDIGDTLEEFLPCKRFDENEKAEIKTPKYKAPRCTVPQTRRKPHEQ